MTATTPPNTRRTVRNTAAGTMLRALAAAALTAATMLPGTVQAQNLELMLEQSKARMNAIVNAAQQQSNAMVQQRMQDPQVQAGYRQHLAQAAQAGRQPMNFQTYTYNWIYTAGYSARGIAHMRNAEAGNQAREHSAWQGLQAAQAERGAAQMNQSANFYNNQQEAGRQLMGNSTFTAGNGDQAVLPHTWQANTTHQYQGNTYHVDQSGKYWAFGSNGYWYPLNR